MYEEGNGTRMHSGERRRYPRLEKEAIVDATIVTYPLSDDQFCRGKTDNISQGGLVMRITNYFDEGSLVQIKIQLPGWQKYHPGFIRLIDDSGKTPFEAIAEVIRSEKVGDQYKIATQFINIDTEDYVAFRKYLDDSMSEKVACQD